MSDVDALTRGRGSAGGGFTPGPWRMHDMERATIVAGRPGGEVANCCNGFGDQDANARLISCAPDLLEALKLAMDALTEAEAILGGEYGDHYYVLCEMMMKLRSQADAVIKQASDE